jgi:hypothetical protein
VQIKELTNSLHGSGSSARSTQGPDVWLWAHCSPFL